MGVAAKKTEKVVLKVVPREDADGYQAAVQNVAGELRDIWQAKVSSADAKNWEFAEKYNREFERLAMLRWGKVPQGRDENRMTRQINQDLKAAYGLEGPGQTWLSHCRRLYLHWPDVIGAGTKQATYDGYRAIVTASVVPKKKYKLREWLERKPRTRAEVRHKVREYADAEAGVSKPDFPVKVSNCWRFSGKTEHEGFDGGIHPELVANLLYYFTDPGDVVIDPMAGGGTTKKVTEKYTFFHAVNEAIPHSGPREVHLADLNPQRKDIVHNNILEGFPWPEDFADFCLFDPPYWKVAEGKYDTFGATIDEWRENVRTAISNIALVLKEGGRLAVVTDDFLRGGAFHPLSAYAFAAAVRAGLRPHAVIYNSFPNFIVSMDAKEMARCKKARVIVNQMKVVNVFAKAD